MYSLYLTTMKNFDKNNNNYIIKDIKKHEMF